MEKKLDFRIQRTYKMLTEALMDTLKEKEFDEITVSGLCEKAMIRRATFYKHFGDKYELFAFAVRELEQQFCEENKLKCDGSNPKDFYVAMMDRVFRFVEQNSEMFIKVLKSKNAKLLLDILSEEIEHDILEHLLEDEKSGIVFLTKPELLAAMISGALMATLRWWMQNDKKMSREELANTWAFLIKIV